MKADLQQKHWVGGACSTGKRGFLERRGAKDAARQLAKAGSPGARPYECPSCGYWHIGHKPGAVMRGEISAHDLYQR